MPSDTHSLRFPDPLWEAAKEAVKPKGISVNGYLTRALENLVEDATWQERALAAEAEVARLRAKMGDTDEREQ